MEIKLLIDREEIAKHCQISVTPHNDVLSMHIRDAQTLDLAPLLGEKLFNSLLSAPEDHEDLMEGGTYDYEGETFTNYGLKLVLSYFAYARYQRFGSVIDTPFSQIEKLEGAESRPTDEFTRKSRYTMYRESAMTYFASVRNYLARTKYDLYENNVCNSQPSTGTSFLKINRIG